jgi:hypothetical protein
LAQCNASRIEGIRQIIMFDITRINPVNLFKAFAGSEAYGRLRVFVIPELENSNPYHLGDSITPTLLLSTDCVNIKLQRGGNASESDPSGLRNYSFWECTVDGSISVDSLQLGAYAVIDQWNNQVIKGTLEQVSRKHSNRYRVTINTSQNVPFEVVNQVIEVIADASNP